jgi:hypothetical protein
MKSVEFSGTIEEFQGMSDISHLKVTDEDGKAINLPITFNGSADQYENLTEARASEDWPGDSEILKFVNSRKLAAAKSSVYQSVTKAVKAAYDKSPAKARKDFVDSALNSPKFKGIADATERMAQVNAFANSMGF